MKKKSGNGIIIATVLSVTTIMAVSVFGKKDPQVERQRMFDTCLLREQPAGECAKAVYLLYPDKPSQLIRPIEQKPGS